MPGNPVPPPVTLASCCRVTAILAHPSDSHIEMELWFPMEKWNGKFVEIGNRAGRSSRAAAHRQGLTAAEASDGGDQCPGAETVSAQASTSVMRLSPSASPVM